MTRHNSTQESFYFLVLLGQCFFLLPVIGFKGNDCNSVKFSWTSFKCIRSIVFSLFVALDLIFFANFFAKQEKRFPQTSGLFYFITVFTYSVLFIGVARKWPKLMKEWHEIDRTMKSYPETSNYPRKMKIMAGIIMTLAVGEHLYFMFSESKFEKGSTITEKLESYFTSIFKSVFIVLPYNLFLGLFLQVLNWLCTLAWNYADVFLITVCMPLNYRFEQIEKEIQIMVMSQYVVMDRWKAVREHLMKLCKLSEHIEECISGILVASIINKLYVVMYQLTGVLTSQERVDQSMLSGTVDRLYFILSFNIILLRIFAVSWITAAVYTKSQSIACSLFSVSSEHYNVEVHRLLIALEYCPPCIRGMRMFKMKNSLTLQIASSIIVYELVLLQYKDY